MPASSDCAALMRSRGARTRGTAADSSRSPAGLNRICSLTSSWSPLTWRRRRPARAPTWTWGRWIRPTTRDCWSSGRDASRNSSSRMRRRRRSSPFSWSW